MKWFQWQPADYIATHTVGEMLELMPPSPIQKMPRIITLLENPSSPIYLPGPAKIEVHDVLHCLVLRGLRAQDEAFVIGFTMGASQGANAADRIAFKNLAGALYPEPFHFSDGDLRVFDVGFDLGIQCKIRNLHLMDSDHLRTLRWREATSLASINAVSLLSAYEKEASFEMDTKASRQVKISMDAIRAFLEMADLPNS